MKKYSLLAFLFLLTALQGYAQPKDEQTSWKVSLSDDNPCIGDEIDVIWKVSIKDPWHMYGTDFDPNCGPIATSFLSKEVTGGSLVGVLREVGAEKDYDEVFGCDITVFHHKAELRQTIKVTGSGSFTSSIEYQICSEGMCIPFDQEFTVNFKAKQCAEEKVSDEGKAPQVESPAVPDGKAQAEEEPCNGCDTVVEVTADMIDPDQSGEAAPEQLESSADVANESFQCDMPRSPGWDDIEASRYEEKDKKLDFWSLLLFFGAAFLSGLLALVTPCVFPMIPMTVTFFTKSSGSKAAGIRNALIYGFSIVAIYTIFGVVMAKLNGPGFANWLATNAVPNAIFFLIFMIFALSFLGLFEITLPSGLVNKVDRQADQGGLIGVFFMAFTLVLVSFSCTGPIVSTILIESAGKYWARPIAGMLGFSLAFAIPFTLFAIFPRWLTAMPKSGGWLNAVKVVLGFVELALAFKFLSQVDRVESWHLLDREVMLSIWIAIGAVTTLYLLGKIRLAHDSPLEKLSVARLFFAIGFMSFTVYMVPGLWGAPLKSLSGVLPPMTTQDFDVQRLIREAGSSESTICEDPIYGESGELKFPHGLDGYFDLRQAICCSREQGKPILIDFTGKACSNCQLMEENVWSDNKVKTTIRDEYILCALYGDYNKIDLVEGEDYTTEDGRHITTIGKANTDFMATKFDIVGQPHYLLLAYDEENSTKTKTILKELNFVNAYDPDIEAYQKWLDLGLRNYGHLQAGEDFEYPKIE